MKLVRSAIGCLAACAFLGATAMAEDAAGPKIDTGVTSWMLISSALVLLMLPGLGMFYGGLVRTKNVLGTMLQCFAAMSVIGVVWTVCGYSMAFGTSHGWCGWNWDYFMLGGIDTAVRASGIPEYVYAMFQGKFAIITPALIAGAFAERVRFRGYCVFIVLWSILVYNPLAHWVWGGGFLTGKAIDFAGGTVIHISSGVAGLVIALYIGARRGYPKSAMHPNNLTMTLIGAGLLWIGWFGFNAGSSEASGLLTGQAFTVTQVAASTGALTWILLEGVLLKKATSLGFASGVLAGLVAITPAAGAVLPTGAMALGAIASIGCYAAIQLKAKLGYDDSLDVMGVHGTAGIIGAVGLTFFMRPNGVEFMTQLWYQVEGSLISIVYSAVCTLILVILVEKTIGFRMSKEDEMAGMDHSLHGEQGYSMLYPS